MAYTFGLLSHLLVLSLVVRLGYSQEVDEIIGVFGKQITIKCSLPDAQQIQWKDLVYNSDREPILIFDSEDNDGLNANSAHPNRHNYKVDNAFSLTISNLTYEDVGKYFCVNEKKENKEFRLTVGERPKCMGNTVLKEGEGTEVSCQAAYYGSSFPKLSWYYNDRMLNSTDHFDIGMAKIMAVIEATWDMNGEEIVCRMEFGGMIEECTLQMDVAFLVKNLQITPTDGFHVGDEVKCSAAGNPTPKLVWSPEPKDQMAGEGFVSFVIPKDMKGQDTPPEFKCTASNTLDDKTEILTRNITLRTIEGPRPGAKTGGSGQIAGIVIGVIIGILVLVVIIVAIICLKKRRSKKGAKQVPSKEEELKKDMDGKGGNSHVAYRKIENEPNVNEPLVSKQPTPPPIASVPIEPNGGAVIDIPPETTPDHESESEKLDLTESDPTENHHVDVEDDVKVAEAASDPDHVSDPGSDDDPEQKNVEGLNYADLDLDLDKSKSTSDEWNWPKKLQLDIDEDDDDNVEYSQVRAVP